MPQQRGMAHNFQYAHGVADYVDLLVAVGGENTHVHRHDTIALTRTYATTAIGVGARLHYPLGKSVEVGASSTVGGVYSARTIKSPKTVYAPMYTMHYRASAEVAFLLSSSVSLQLLYSYNYYYKIGTHTIGVGLSFRLP